MSLRIPTTIAQREPPFYDENRARGGLSPFIAGRDSYGYAENRAPRGFQPLVAGRDSYG